MPNEPREIADVIFTLNGAEVTAHKGEMIIEAAERAGTDIPRFCYHPRMAPVGVCRMCLVEVDGPRGSTLVPSCFMAVSDGMVVNTESEKVTKAQDGVLEFLLANHPLDCPICDKGGECSLQDQTIEFGPGASRFTEQKRHYEKPIEVSSLVLLDRERCIQCSRCTRFADEIAGEPLIDFVGRGDEIEVATFPDAPFASYFSGNTVQLCPVGALTAAPYRFAARPWDLEQVESTCTGCAVGCRVVVQSSSGQITRFLGVDNEAVSHGWLCDKGRFSYEALNGPERDEPTPPLTDPARRLTHPLVRKDGDLVAVGWGEALRATATIITDATANGPEGLGVVGGAALTNEGAFAYTALFKGVIGTDSVDAQFNDSLDASHLLELPRASIEETTNARAIVTLCGDLREEAPVLFLRLRGAAEAGVPLIDIGPRATSLSDLATARLPARPGDSLEIARALAGDTAAATRLRSHPEGATFTTADLDRATALLGAEGDGVVVVLGRASLAEDASIPEAAARQLLAAFPAVRFLPIVRRANVMGALDMGMAPGFLPGRRKVDEPSSALRAAWPTLPATEGRSTVEQLAALANGSQRALIVIGSDLIGNVPDSSLVTSALASTAPVVVISGHGGSLLEHADVVLPATVAHERDGTTTNLEGRCFRLEQKQPPKGSAWADWMIAAELAEELGADLGLRSRSDITSAIERLAPSHAGITEDLLASPAGALGVLAPLVGLPSLERAGVDPISAAGFTAAATNDLGIYDRSPSELDRPAPGHVVPERREGGTMVLGERIDPILPAPDRYSLRLVAGRVLYDDGGLVRASPSLAALRQSAIASVNPYDLDRIGAASGDQVALRLATQRLVVEVNADPGVIRGTVSIPFDTTDPVTGITNVVGSLLTTGDLLCELRMESR